MGRLIDEDDVKKMISDTFEKEKDVINSFWKMGTLMDKVDEIQTAYDVDAVVEQLEMKIDNAEFDELLTSNEKDAYVDAYRRAIEVVKGGGVDNA